VRALRAQGHDILSLTLGEPDFDTPDHIREAAIAAIREGFTHYPPVAGIAELRAAAAEVFTRRNGIAGLAAENIVVSTGAKQSLLNALMALVNPGDEVILVAPYWVSYLPMVHMAQGRPVLVHTRADEGFALHPEALEAAITPRTRLVVLNSPNNPTGAMIGPAAMDALVAVLARHPHVLVLSDEIYELIAYDARHVSPGAYAELAERVVTVNGMSKAYAMTGWRVGLMAAPKWIAAACEKYQGQVTSGTSSISQRAALAALTGPLEPTRAMVARFRQRRDLLCAELAQHVPQWRVAVPAGAFYLFPDVSAHLGRRTPQGQVLATADALADYLLDHGVSTVPGSANGVEGFLRLSYACSDDELREAVRRMAAALGQLQ
jgi:aspartate aminotransferase